MKRIMIVIVSVSLLCAGLVWWTSTARAAPRATYSLIKTTSGPSSTSSAGLYKLSNSIGQSISGEASAGKYTLGGGFWGGGILLPIAAQHALYLPLILK